MLIKIINRREHKTEFAFNKYLKICILLLLFWCFWKKET